MHETIKEGSAIIRVKKAEKISKEMEVFYNPVMKLNRDITILLLQQFPPMHLCDPLAASGVRSIRLAKELKYKSIAINDINKKAVKSIKNNKITNEKIIINENKKELLKFLKVIKDESKINSIGFYDLHDIAEKKRLRTMGKKEDIIKKIKKKGYMASGTHFSGTGIRSDISYRKLLPLLKE